MTPENLEELIDQDKYGIWDDETTFAPLKLSVMKGVLFGGRPIALSWQIEFEPCGEKFEGGNSRLESLGLDADGYGWATLINSVFKKYHPDLLNEVGYGRGCLCRVGGERKHLPHTCRCRLELDSRQMNIIKATKGEPGTVT